MSCRQAVISLWKEAMRLMTGIKYLQRQKYRRRDGTGAGSRVKQSRPACAHTTQARNLQPMRVSAAAVRAILDRDAAFFDTVASHAAALDGERPGPLLLAAFVGKGAARMKAAAWRRIERARHLARDRRALPAAHLEIGDRVEQHAGVGVLGSLEQRIGRRLLDQPAEIHHADAGRDVI